MNRKKYAFEFLFILSLTVLTLIIDRYSLFNDDQTITIPYVKYYHNNTLFPNDTMVRTADYYVSYLWIIVSPFIEYVDVRLIYYLLYFLSISLFYYSIMKLSTTLFNKKVGYLTCLLLLIPNASLAGIKIFDNYLNTRTFVLPFLILALNYLIINKPKKSIFITGIIFNLHIISSAIFFLIIFFTLLIKRYKFKEIINIILIFLLLISPSLIWKIYKNIPQPIFMDNGYREILEITSSAHLFPTTWRLEWVNLIYPLIIYAKLRNKSKINIDPIIISVLIVLVITIISDITNLYYLNALQLGRVNNFLIILSMAYLSNYILLSWKNDKLTTSIITLLFFMTRVYFIGLAMVFFILSLTKIKNKYIIYTLYVILLLIVFKLKNVDVLILYLLLLLPIISLKNWKIAILILLIFLVIYNLIIAVNKYKEYYNLMDVCMWLNKNVEYDKLILLPPYDNEARTIIERSIILTNNDGTLSNFFYNYSIQWYNTMKDLKCIDVKKCEYDNLTEPDFIRLYKKYKFDYLVTKRLLNLNLAYNNSEYYVYNFTNYSEIT